MRGFCSTEIAVVYSLHYGVRVGLEFPVPFLSSSSCVQGLQRQLGSGQVWLKLSTVFNGEDLAQHEIAPGIAKYKKSQILRVR